MVPRLGGSGRGNGGGGGGRGNGGGGGGRGNGGGGGGRGNGGGGGHTCQTGSVCLPVSAVLLKRGWSPSSVRRL